MAFNSVLFTIIFRVIMMALFIVSGAYLLLNTNLIVIPTVNFAMALLIAIRMVRSVYRAENNFVNFLQAVKYFDLVYLENIRNKRTHKKYRALYDEVVDIFRKMKAEKEIHFENLQSIVRQISTAIICYNEKGEVKLINPAALELLNKPHLTNFATVEKFDEGLYREIRNMRSNEQVIFKRIIHNRIQALNIQVREFRLQGVHHTLVMMQNLKNELDTQEIESYRKLISVLTHEIMNSITPVISLSEIIQQHVSEENMEQWKKGETSDDSLEEVRMSAGIIVNRSKNLLKFVHNYRSLTKIPQPQPESTDIGELCLRTVALLNPAFQAEHIAIHVDCPVNVYIVPADTAMIEQVLINLLKNAMEALKSQEDKKIVLRLYKEKEKICVDVNDNGPGMEKEVLDQVFVPFFTTKIQGSGIGLSFSKQVMRMHGGNIYVRSTPNQGTVFTLEF